MTFAEILPRSIFFKFAFGRYKLNVMIYMILTTNQETFSLMILAKRNRQQEQQRAANALNSIALWKHLTKQSFFSTFIYIIYIFTMVRVWYEPPPFGPATDLNRNAYGWHGGNSLPPRMMERIMKMPQGLALAVPTFVICVLCYIPVST